MLWLNCFCFLYQCVDDAAVPTACLDVRDDYIECLHHYKEVRGHPCSLLRPPSEPMHIPTCGSFHWFSELTLCFSVWIRLPHLAFLFPRRWLATVHAHEGRSSRNGCQGPKDGWGKAASISGNASGTRGRGPLSLHPHRDCSCRWGVHGWAHEWVHGAKLLERGEAVDMARSLREATKQGGKSAKHVYRDHEACAVPPSSRQHTRWNVAAQHCRIKQIKNKKETTPIRPQPQQRA